MLYLQSARKAKSIAWPCPQLRMASFISARDIEATKTLKKQKKRKEREAIMEEAKIAHQKKKFREEPRENWMAPSLHHRFSEKKLPCSSKIKGEKKKTDKSKRSRKEAVRASSPSSDSDDGDWVERNVDTESTSTLVAATNSTPETKIHRDSWMKAPPGPSQSSLFTIEKRRIKHDVQKEIKTPGQHPRELNPFWKNGGTGLPSNPDNQKPVQRTGDGGHSWMLRAYKRALEEAETKGKTLEDIATVRWGSLDKLYSLLHAAGIDPSNPDKALKLTTRDYLYAEPKHTNNCVSPKRSLGFTYEVKQFHAVPQKVDDFLIPEDEAFVGERYKSSNEQDEVVVKKKQISSHQNICLLPQESKLESTLSRRDITDSEPEVTDAVLNALSAKIMKAEILGDFDKVQKLKKKLDRLRKLKKNEQTPSSSKQESLSKPQVKTIPLVSTDRFGRVRPLDSSKAIKNHDVQHVKKNKRKKYADDGEGYSLQELVEQERKLSTRDTQFALAGMASKFVSSSKKDDVIDEKQASKVAISYDPKHNDSKEFLRAMTESKRLTDTIENCKLCFGNDNFSKHLLVAVGISVYLAVPATQSLTKGHCLLIPMEHHSSLLLLDENVWEEIKVFQKGLTRMFQERNCDIVFTESYFKAYKRTHAYLECIPIPKEEGGMAPMYFKKAIMESEDEWSLNRKLIDTKLKGVRSSLPVGLPYFFVEFGVDGGFAHIVENEDRFPSYFAKEVVGGMLDLEPQLWLKPPLDAFENQKSKTLELSEWWQPYDWTQKLKD